MSPRPFRLGSALALVLALACGGGGGGAGTSLSSGGPPSPPSGLASTGALGRISLTWNASPGASGYYVYRSAPGGSPARLNASPVSALAYDDLLASPGADGVLYTYQVTAASASGESAPSASTANLHGTRLPAANPAGFTASTVASPYVVEGTATVDGGDVTVQAGAMLCVKPGGVLSLQDAATLRVQGTFRALGTAAAPAVVNGHGFAANDPARGIGVVFDGATAYNAGTGLGCLLDHAQITGLALGNARLRILNAAPALRHCKIASNDPQGRTYLELMTGCGAAITRCAFTGVVPTLNGDLRSQGFSLSQCTFSGGYYGIYVGPLTSPGLAAGQFTGNLMNGAKDAVLYFVTASSDVPLAGNYWSGGTGTPPLPAVNPLGSTNTATLTLMPALTSAPSPAGPDW
ncbi:MAG: fibronectin type III domain-containing protein [Holophagaceae bacterium]